MAHTPVEEVGGIEVAKRTIPAWLIVVAVAIISVATWYLLSFSSTDYRGGYPRFDEQLEQADSGGH